MFYKTRSCFSEKISRNSVQIGSSGTLIADFQNVFLYRGPSEAAFSLYV